MPFWVLSLVLGALQHVLYDILQSVELIFLSMKTLLLIALASMKRVGDLQIFLVDKSIMPRVWAS